MLLVMAALALHQSEPVMADVDGSVKFQTMMGFGTCLISWDSAMAEWYRRPESVRMYVQEMGFNILRTNLWAGDHRWPKQRPEEISHTDPTFAQGDPRTPVFLRFAQDAKKLDPSFLVVGTVWSPPAWMKENGQTRDTASGALVNGSTYELDRNGVRSITTNRVKPEMYDHFTKWLAEMVLYYRKNGVDLYAVSPANEPQFTQDFESCVWTARDLALITARLRATLDAHGLRQVKLFAPETMTGFNWEGGPNQQYTRAFRENPAAFRALDIWATHGYADGVKGDVSVNSSAQFWELIKDTGKPFWVTEGGTGEFPWPEPVREKGVGPAVHNSLVAGHASAFVPWQFAEGRASEHALTLLDGLSSKAHVLRQYSRYIPRGSVRVRAEPGFGDVLLSAFVKDKDVTIVALNPSPSARRVDLQLRNLPAIEQFRVSRTSATEKGAPLSNLRVLRNRATVDLPGDSVTTLTTLRL